MKQIWFVAFFAIITFNLQSQKIDNDTIPEKRAVKSHWAIKLETGVLLHQMFNPDFVANNAGQTVETTVFYKNFFFSYSAFMLEFMPITYMTVDNILVSKQDKFNSFNINMAVGYSYDFHRNWSADMRLGFNSTNFEITNNIFPNLVYETDFITGAQLGLGIDRYIHIRRFNFIAIGFGIDYYTTDYSELSPKLKPSSLNYSLTIGYKGFFRRMID